MFALHSKRFHLLIPNPNPHTHFHFFPKLPPLTLTQSHSSSSSESDDDNSPQDSSFTVKYLIHSLGFTPKSAQTLSKTHSLRFNSPEKPDSVINLLKRHGFTDTQIPSIIRKQPLLLLCNAEKILAPKLEFLTSIGFTPATIANVMNYNQRILAQSLENSLKPCYDILKSVPIPDDMVPVFFKHSSRVLGNKLRRNLAPNIDVLREIGIPESVIAFCVTYHPLVLSPDTSKMRESVEKILGLGIPASSFNFMKALQVVSQMDEAKWAQKKEFYKKCGWSEENFMFAFKKNPLFMSLSEKKCLSKIEFLVNVMGWKPAAVAESPYILTHSLENSIIPRCSVIRVLQHKGLITAGKLSMTTMLTKSSQRFHNRFVMKYQDQAPEVVSIIEGKLTLADLGLGFEESGDSKKCV